MNTADIADLYADISAVIAALTEALKSKGLLTDQEIATAAGQVLAELTATPARPLEEGRDDGNPHPYLMLRILANSQ